MSNIGHAKHFNIQGFRWTLVDESITGVKGNDATVPSTEELILLATTMTKTTNIKFGGDRDNWKSLEVYTQH